MVGPDVSHLELYKYLSPDGAKKTLSTRTIRLSRPSEFNDPFDMRLDQALGLDHREFAEEQKRVIVDFIGEELDLSSLRSSKLGTMAGIINMSVKNWSTAKKKSIREELVATPLEDLYDFDSLKNAEVNAVIKLQNNINRYGVFCTTVNNDSLLMWAHYAQSHQGAILAFMPDFKSESILSVSKPMQYTKDRPLLYRTPSDLLRHGLNMSREESARRLMDALIFTKSSEWEYEQEYRLAIPDFIPIDASFNTLSFAPNELSAVYLGCRISSSDKAELIELARLLNEKVGIYQARVAPREYALEFETLDRP